MKTHSSEKIFTTRLIAYLDFIQGDIQSLQRVIRQLYTRSGTIHESETSLESLPYYHGSHAEHADPNSKLGKALNSSSSSNASTVTEI